MSQFFSIISGSHFGEIYNPPRIKFVTFIQTRMLDAKTCFMFDLLKGQITYLFDDDLNKC